MLLPLLLLRRSVVSSRKATSAQVGRQHGRRAVHLEESKQRPGQVRARAAAIAACDSCK
jgi:hypothetical protein